MNVFILGTGNVATSLGNAFRKTGHTLTGVYGRNDVRVRSLGRKWKCMHYSDLKNIPDGSDVYLVAVSDDAISDLYRSLPPLSGVVAHTSGVTPMKQPGKHRNGVFYPLESITATRPASFKKVPICIEAGDKPSEGALLGLASSISGNTHLIGSKQRATLHLAAVFVNNFTNHILGTAFRIAGRIDTSTNLLESLAHSTIRNAFREGPGRSQTGPARRGDQHTLERHIKMLRNDRDALDLYHLLSRQIARVYKKGKNNRRFRPIV